MSVKTLNPFTFSQKKDSFPAMTVQGWIKIIQSASGCDFAG
jgi:hypothetical protein